MSGQRSKTVGYGLHPNYIVAKYERMKRTGEIDRIDQMLRERETEIMQQAELDQQYSQVAELQAYN